MLFANTFRILFATKHSLGSFFLLQQTYIKPVLLQILCFEPNLPQQTGSMCNSVKFVSEQFFVPK